MLLSLASKYDVPHVQAEALRRLDGCTDGIVDVGLRRPDLDDVFLTLTGHSAEDGDPSGGTPDQQRAAEPTTTGASR